MVMSHSDHSRRLGAIERRFWEKEILGDEGQVRKLSWSSTSPCGAPAGPQPPSLSPTPSTLVTKMDMSKLVLQLDISPMHTFPSDTKLISKTCNFNAILDHLWIKRLLRCWSVCFENGLVLLEPETQENHCRKMVCEALGGEEWESEKTYFGNLAPIHLQDLG